MLMANVNLHVYWENSIIYRHLYVNYKENCIYRRDQQTIFLMAVVVAQLAKRSLPTPEVRGSIPDISKVLLNNVYC